MGFVAALAVGGPVKVLSIRQPWAWAIVHGYKPVENRSWYASYRGPLLIHAGKVEERADIDACLGLVEDQVIEGTRYNRVARLKRRYLAERRLGCVVGRVEMRDCVSSLADLERSLGNLHGWHRGARWWGGPYGFVLVNAQRVEPVELRGRLGLWDATVQVRAL